MEFQVKASDSVENPLFRLCKLRLHKTQMFIRNDSFSFLLKTTLSQ